MSAEVLPSAFPLEPNPAEGRGITTGYLTELSNFLLGQMSWGRRCGLLPGGPGRLSSTSTLRGEWLELDAILAIGENGQPLVSDPRLGMKIEPLDLHPLPEGEHLIYACLAGTRVPFGEPLSIRRGETDASAVVARYRASQICLVPATSRPRYVDGLPIALVRRRNVAGVLVNDLEPSFHPAITDLSAWMQPHSPLAMLAEMGVRALGQDRDDPLGRLARVELTVLGNISTFGDPEVAFVQAQRCLGLLRAMTPPPLSLPGQLEQMPYRPLELWKFMALLGDSLAHTDGQEPLPIMLVIDGKPHLRAGGKFRWEDPFWRWLAIGDALQVASMSLYFPHAIEADLPLLLAGRSKEEGIATVTRPVPVESTGAALQLQGISAAVDTIYLSAANAADGPRLRNSLGKGHALYYR